MAIKAASEIKAGDSVHVRAKRITGTVVENKRLHKALGSEVWIHELHIQTRYDGIRTVALLDDDNVIC